MTDETRAADHARVGADFDPDSLALLELRAWKAYYRRQALRLFGLVALALRQQGGASWPRAIWAALWLSKAAVGFGRATGDYDRFGPAIARGYRALGLPATIDVEEVGRWELRWWVVRREMGLAAAEAAGTAITNVYAAFYNVPRASVAEAGRLRGLAAAVRDAGASADLDGPKGAGRSYWPEVGRLLRASYRSLSDAVRSAPDAAADESRQFEPSVRPVDGPRPTTRTGTPPRPGAA